jgi:hypothetical protein
MRHERVDSCADIPLDKGMVWPINPSHQQQKIGSNTAINWVLSRQRVIKL